VTRSRARGAPGEPVLDTAFSRLSREQIIRPGAERGRDDVAVMPRMSLETTMPSHRRVRPRSARTSGPAVTR
jgi:hypothetical protein